MNPDGVAAQLKEWDQWLLWSGDSKPPVRPLGPDAFPASKAVNGRSLRIDLCIQLLNRHMLASVQHQIRTQIKAV